MWRPDFAGRRGVDRFRLDRFDLGSRWRRRRLDGRGFRRLCRRSLGGCGLGGDHRLARLGLGRSTDQLEAGESASTEHHERPDDGNGHDRTLRQSRNARCDIGLGCRPRLRTLFRNGDAAGCEPRHVGTRRALHRGTTFDGARAEVRSTGTEALPAGTEVRPRMARDGDGGTRLTVFRRNGDRSSRARPVVDGFRELGRRLKSMLDVTRHPLRDDRAKRSVEIGNDGERRRRRRQDDLEQQLVEGLGVEGHLPGDRFVHHDADRVEVASRIRFAAAVRLFGRHVIGRTHHRAGAGHVHHVAGHRLELRDPEVDDLDVVGLSRLLAEDVDVVRLEVAVNDACRVSGGEPGEDLAGERDDLARRQADPSLDAGAQRLAVQVLHHHEAVVVGQRAEVEHLEDVIAADTSGGLSFALEALHGFGVACGRGVEHLDRHPSPDADVLPFVHGTHTALADQSDDPVLALDDLSDFERHGRIPRNRDFHYTTGPRSAKLLPRCFSPSRRRRIAIARRTLVCPALLLGS